MGPGAAAAIEWMAALCRAEQLVFALLGDGATRHPSPVASVPAVTVADRAGHRARLWYEAMDTDDPDTLLRPSDADRRVWDRVRALVVDDLTLLVVVADGLLPCLRRALIAHDAGAGAANGVERSLAELDADREALVDARARVGADPVDRARADHAAAEVRAEAERVGWPIPGV